MIRKGLLALALLALSSVATALGLGPVEQRSRLNEPLDMRIALLRAPGEDVTGLRVGLAETTDFERAGVERTSALGALRFETVSAEDGTHYIHVTTRSPVREPALRFVMEVAWPEGRIVRDYGLLFDPPR